MKTQYLTASSLDGFVADAGHNLDWLLQFGTEGGGTYPEFIKAVGALAMGSATYEWLLRNHVNAPTPNPWPYDVPAWVFSSRDLPGVAGADIRFARGDVRPVHAEMARAANGRNVWVVGGGDLAGRFFDAGLLDEVVVQVAPVILGTGTPLLPRRVVTPPLRLVSAAAYGPFAELRYEVPR